jgi:hypothetical protein
MGTFHNQRCVLLGFDKEQIDVVLNRFRSRCCHRRQLEYAAVLGDFGDVAAPQSEPHGVELVNVFRGEVRRPRGIVLDQFDRDFGGVFAFVDEFF